MTAPQTPASLANSGPRFAFLDGLRGLAALYVALFHNVWDYAKKLGAPYGVALGWLRHGGYAVDVFIVLSGFCLMMPVAMSPDWSLKGGLNGFFHRRARRILPPYFAALLATWILLLVSPEGLAILRGRPSNPAWLANFNPSNIIYHLLLIHNWDSRWNASVDFPMWSVATEWQIYGLFCLFLLPVARSLGMSACAGLALAFGLLPRLLLPPARNLDWAAPWLVILFYIGMLAAVIAFGNVPTFRGAKLKLPWGSIGAILFLALIFLNQLQAKNQWFEITKALLVGAIAFCLMLSCVHSVVAEQPHLIARLLETRFARYFGSISYSLYLIHVPAMFSVVTLMNHLRLTPEASLWFRVAFGVPWMLLAAALFFRLVERRFTTPKRTNIPSGGAQRPAYSLEGANAAVQPITSASELSAD